eukprot:gnl/MRDRNA2_/MRDRNA2_55741_c0_seq2.p1 gnl/MRDRNA2_/MRDRNA2_55741_c0~~gnl/MRDRNA2_/MRDRNA2_55741_c0_seq2.p1  ORF type:complete len:207 (+),score=41.33 gnl/MRDRNA2_/MRDRNA2_55741_c0_seq2:102-722(+)
MATVNFVPIMGRTVKMFAHATCFLQKMRCEYSPAKRGRCALSKQPFEKGDLRVLFSALTTTWIFPGEAKQWTRAILQVIGDAEGGQLIKNMQGLQSLRGEHRSVMIDMLCKGSPSPTEPLRCVPGDSEKKRKHGDKSSPVRRRQKHPKESGADRPVAEVGDSSSVAAAEDVERPPFKRLRRAFDRSSPSSHHSAVIDLSSDSASKA